MKFTLNARRAVTLGTAISGAALAAATLAGTAAAAQPGFKAVAKAAKSPGNITLGVADQAGTGSQALLEAAHLITPAGSNVYKLKGYSLKLTFNDETNGPADLQAVDAGSDQIAGVGNAPPVFADSSGDGLVLVGELGGPVNSAGLLVAPNSGINTIQDLAGKTIGVGTGTSADFHFLQTLKAAGLSKSQVNVVNVSGGNGVAELESGAIQAYDTWSPFIEALEDKGYKEIINDTYQGKPFSNASYQVASASALKNPKYVAAIGDYLTAVYEAHLWSNKHPVQWATYWASQTGYSQAVMDQATLDDQLKPIAINAATVTSEQTLVGDFASVGEIPASYNIGKYITSAFNSSVTTANAAKIK